MNTETKKALSETFTMIPIRTHQEEAARQDDVFSDWVGWSCVALMIGFILLNMARRRD